MPDDQRTLFERLNETEYAMFDDGAHATPTPFGTFITHPDFPSRYDCNQVVRCRCRVDEVPALLQDLERRSALLGLGHRKISGIDSATGDVLARVLPELGWRLFRSEVLWKNREPEVPVNPAVEIRAVDPTHPDLVSQMTEDGKVDGGFLYHRSQWPRLGGEWLVGYLDGKPAGTTGWFVVNGVARYRWVGTEAWARRRGVAATLIQYVQRHPTVRAAEALTIHVGEDLPDARRLYGRLGFTSVGWAWDWMKELKGA